MSKNRFLVLLENALNHLDIKDTIRTYLYILSAYTYYDNAAIDNIECLNIVSTSYV